LVEAREQQQVRGETPALKKTEKKGRKTVFHEKKKQQVEQESGGKKNRDLAKKKN